MVMLMCALLFAVRANLELAALQVEHVLSLSVISVRVYGF